MKTVAAAIIRNDSKVLIGRRAPKEMLAGFWEFPGGKVEDGESLQACLQRELLEELNIYTKVSDIIAVSEYQYEQGAIKLVALNTLIIEGEIFPTVHDVVEWAEISALLDYKLAPADIPIAEKLKEII